MSIIRLFVCCHSGFDVIPPFGEPIQCGTALSTPMEGTLHDNDGDTISELNREYCEMTAHYYAWKNIDADYYGFCHYRRFLCAAENAAMPYLVCGKLTEEKALALLRDEGYWRSIIEENDIIAPRSEDMGISAREHYCSAACHYAEDLDVFFEILTNKAPQLTDCAKEYLSGRRQYFCNMFFMDKAHFHEYCGILFEVLAEFDMRKKLHGSFQSDRTDGYLSEIFTGIYISHCRKQGARIKELPRLDTNCTKKKLIGYALFPPESRRRFIAKRIAKMLKGK